MRKEFQKNGKGNRRCWADAPPFRPSWTARPAPPPLSPARAAPASLHPAPATWRPYAGVGHAAAGHLHPPGRDANPRPQNPTSILSPASLPPPSARAAAAAAVPPRAITGASPAARRRPHQSSKLEAKSTSALAVAAISPCVRSTEVRSSRAP